MSDSVNPTRRGVLRLAAGASFFPLAGPLDAALRSAGPLRKPLRARFLPMAAPSLERPDQLATTHVASAIEVHFDDGSKVTSELDYEALFITGDWVADGEGGKTLAGGHWTIRGEPVIDRSVPGRERQAFSSGPDGMSLLEVGGAQVDGVEGNTVFAVVQFEYTSRNLKGDSAWGTLPSPIAVLTLDQNPETGKLRLVQYRNVDTADVHGLWVTCGASLSPWNTHLSSEEYEPDAAAVSAQFLEFSQNLYGSPTRANPYHYGHLPEVTVHPDGTGTVKKHYCTGRISHELVQVMPDERTVLAGDDWSNGGLFLFVADRPRDLSSGALYVASWHAREDPNTADLTWIHLGSATSDEIEQLIDSGLRAADIMDIRREDPGDETFTKIPYAGRFNWVRLRKGMEKAAAFLETHRYAALMGGSLGFTKMEGTTVNVADRVAYSAISRIETPMRNGSGGIHATGPYSGAVFALNLRGERKDEGGRPIDSEWVPVDMAPIPGLMSDDLKQPDALGNRANPDKVATPDNLKFSESLRTLFVGEDSNTHVNNFLWAYNVDTGELARILSCPVGAESTGLHAVDDLNGWTYIATNFQHAGDWSESLHAVVRPKVEKLIHHNFHDRFGAAVGYLTAKLER